MDQAAMSSTNCSLTTSNTMESVLRIASNIALSVVMSLISIMAVASNALVVGTVVKTPSLQSPANLMLCSLSLSDLLTGLLTVPLSVICRLLFIHFTVSLCVYQTVLHVYRFCLNLLAPASFMMLCLLSWDRYKAVSSPLVYRAEASKRKTVKLLAATWVTLLVLRLSMIHLENLRVIFNAVIACGLLLFLVLMQAATYRAMQRHNREIAATNSQATVAVALEREKKLVTTSRYVLAALAFSLVVPLIVYLVAILTKTKVDVQSDIVAWTNAVLFMNSCIDPLIYFLRHSDMRHAAFRLLGH